MTNTALLIQKIEDSGLKKAYIAEKINMTYANFWRMLESGAEFKPSQINTLCDLLRIEDLEERKEIFLI